MSEKILSSNPYPVLEEPGRESDGPCNWALPVVRLLSKNSIHIPERQITEKPDTCPSFYHGIYYPLHSLTDGKKSGFYFSICNTSVCQSCFHMILILTLIIMYGVFIPNTFLSYVPKCRDIYSIVKLRYCININLLQEL